MHGTTNIKWFKLLSPSNITIYTRTWKIYNIYTGLTLAKLIKIGIVYTPVSYVIGIKAYHQTAE